MYLEQLIIKKKEKGSIQFPKYTVGVDQRANVSVDLFVLRFYGPVNTINHVEPAHCSWAGFLCG